MQVYKCTEFGQYKLINFDWIYENDIKGVIFKNICSDTHIFPKDKLVGYVVIMKWLVLNSTNIALSMNSTLWNLSQ